MESQMEEWYREVGQLQVQAASISEPMQVKGTVAEQQAAVEARMVRLIEPLKERRRILLASKEVHQVGRDLEEEILWVQERLPMAMCQEHGASLQAVQQLMKKNQTLQRELQGHRSRVDDVLERAAIIASIRSPEADCVRTSQDQLSQLWALLWAETERRQLVLDAMYQAQQYYFDTAEVEAWLSEQELHMMNEEKGKYWLYQLNREVDELEQWIAQREVVASSPELGQDFEHVTVSVS
ncbi:unnamed protein product, partial [Lampetra planeri]